MSKHTPGPWLLRDDEFVSVPGCVICVAPEEDLERSRAAWPANARLIAAAPEMLEALKAALAAPIIYTGGGEDESIDDCGLVGVQPIRDKIRGAIAKAEGRT